MKSDPEQAADRHARAVIIAVISFILSAAILLALVTTIHGIDTRLASNDAPPGTTGLARPHPPIAVSLLRISLPVLPVTIDR